MKYDEDEQECSLSFCHDPYHATFDGDLGPIDLCLEHFDDVAR